MRTSIRTACAVAGIAGLFVAAAAGAAPYAETQLTSNAIPDRYPLLANSGDVFWMAYPGTSSGGADLEIFHYDGSLITQLSNNAVDDVGLRANETGQAAWLSEDYTIYPPVSELVYFDGSGTTVLSGGDFVQGGFSLNDAGDVVWSANVGGFSGPSEVFLYDGATVQQLTVTGNTLDPYINNAGAMVWLWHDGTDYEVIYFDGVTATQLTNNSEPDVGARIGNDGTVVWSHHDGTDYEVMLYKAGVIQQLTNNTVDDSITRAPNDSGQFFFYRGSSSPNIDLMFYDGAAVQTVATTIGDDDTATPSLNNAGQLAFSKSDGTDLELFVWDGAVTTQVTDNALDDYRAGLNDVGALAWQRDHGDLAEIILAVPVGVRLVAIDVRPGSADNPVNPGARGVLPVALLSDPGFDATTVVPASIRVAGAPVRMRGRSGAYLCRAYDVNGDALPDLVCQVELAQMELAFDATTVTLTGTTVGGEAVEGSAPVRIVPGA